MALGDECVRGSMCVWDEYDCIKVTFQVHSWGGFVALGSPTEGPPLRAALDALSGGQTSFCKYPVITEMQSVTKRRAEEHSSLLVVFDCIFFQERPFDGTFMCGRLNFFCYYMYM